MEPEARKFTGEPEADLEVWLGDVFESWIPSRRELAIRIRGSETIVRAGQWICQEEGEVTVHG